MSPYPCLYFWWVTLAVDLQNFNVRCGKYLFINQTKSNSLRCRILMFNIMLLVNKALLVVLPMCLALLQRADTLSFVFNALCSIWMRNIFDPFLYNFVEHFQRFCNGTNNITNALKTIINALQCIFNAFKMHCQRIQNALSTHSKCIVNAFKTHKNAVFVKPGFPKEGHICAHHTFGVSRPEAIKRRKK